MLKVTYLISITFYDELCNIHGEHEVLRLATSTPSNFDDAKTYFVPEVPTSMMNMLETTNIRLPVDVINTVGYICNGEQPDLFLVCRKIMNQLAQLRRLCNGPTVSYTETFSSCNLFIH